ncbi:MAG: hypothetical protein ACPH3L_09595 [Flavobacteriaceae bacterium]
MKKTPPKVQKYKYGKNYNKSDYSKRSYKNKPVTDGRYASPTKKTTDGRYASPTKKTTDGRYASPTKKFKNDINKLPRGLRMDTTTGIGTTIIKPKMGQRIDTKKSRPKKFKK